MIKLLTSFRSSLVVSIAELKFCAHQLKKKRMKTEDKMCTSINILIMTQVYLYTDPTGTEHPFLLFTQRWLSQFNINCPRNLQVRVRMWSTQH